MRFNLAYDLSVEIHEMLIKAKPWNATGAYQFKWDYMLTSFLSKHPSLDGGVSPQQRKKAAISKMMVANERCKRINDLGYTDQSHSFKAIIARASRVCSETLGDFSCAVFESARFTSGATTSRLKKRGDPFYKFHQSVPVDVTYRAFPLAYALISATPLWAAQGGLHNINIVRGNAVMTVPKDSEIDRTMAKEADLNGLLQNALGTAFRLRLLRIGINLQDQSGNQALAWIGSCDDTLATIDLSSASDSVSYRLVWDLISKQWFDILDAVRSPIGVLEDGSEITWSMFSSMGNGFTFGLETLIFYSLAKAVMEEAGITPVVGSNLLVYGDDIVVPSACADRLIHVLRSVGFLPNKDKTFVNGPFRESCGRHYFGGFDVTPFYVRQPITDLSRVVWFLNRLRAWAYDEHTGVCDPSVYTVWLRIRRKYLPAKLLGGYDPEDISRCVSLPVSRSHRLVYEKISRPIHGWRACLRWFQFQSSQDDVRYGTIDVGDVSTFGTYESLISKVLPDKVLIKPLWDGEDEGQYDSSSLSANTSYLFPEELVVSPLSIN